MASRAALRVMANVGSDDRNAQQGLILCVFRANLTSAICGFNHTNDMRENLFSAANAAAFAADSSAAATLTPISSAQAAAKASANAAISAADAVDDGLHLAADAAAHAVLNAQNSLLQSTLSADLAVDPAVNATAIATSIDSGFQPDHLMNVPVWSASNTPEPIFLAHGIFMQSLYVHPDWLFWANWYRGMWDGTFREWDLAIEVALIPNEVWEGEDAVAKVAAAIREIEARRAEYFRHPDSVPELKQKKLLDHVRRLLESPDMTALAAEGAADILERAIAQYLKEALANCLPDALAHLEGVPSLFRRIATTVKSAERADAKEAKLAADVEALNAKIARLEADLRDARAKTVHGLFTQSALKAAGTAFGAGLVGSLGLAVSHFFGEWPSDLTLGSGLIASKSRVLRGR